MKALKYVFIVLVAIIALVVVISFFLPSKVKVQRSAVINAPKEIVFDQINTMKSWEKWSPWHDIDTAVKITYNEIEKGVGAKYTWASSNPKVGNGALTVTRSIPNDSIITEVDFTGQGKSISSYILENEGEKTKVTWVMDFDLGANPIAKFFGLKLDDAIGQDFEKGLANLNILCSTMPKFPDVKIELKNIDKIMYIGIKDSCSMADMSKKMGELYGELGAFMKKSKIEANQPPFAMYLSYTAQSTVFIAGFPVKKPIKKLSGRIFYMETSPVTAAFALHTGSYMKVERVYNAMDEWIKMNNKKIAGAPWEVYLTDPATEKDTSKWMTEVYFPVQ
jgi:effector-binding domain-containing protein